MEERKTVWERVVVGFLVFVGVLGLVLFALLFAVIFVAGVEDWATKILGISGDMSKQKVIEFISFGIAGILGFFGAVAVNSRAEAQIQTAKAQVENNKLIEKGHIQERFKTAVKNLESEHKTVRITPFYDFYHLARDNDDMRENIFDILCAHLQQIISDGEYKAKVEVIAGEEIVDTKPTKQVQSLLNVLFQSKDRQENFVFAGLKATLRGIFLMEANLHKAYLQNADLYKANLWGADLREAKLQNADLQIASLQGSDLRGADLYKANLWGADLRGAKLQDTNLRGANLCETYLQGSNLHEAKLQSANLRSANLQGVNLGNTNFRDAKLQGANLQGANLQDADLRGADLQGADLQGANLQNAKLQGADLQKADLRHTDLQCTELQNAKLQGADLRKADLRDAELQFADFRNMDLQGANLLGADLEYADLRGVDLQEAEGLNVVKLSRAKVKGAKFPEGYKLPEDVDDD